MADMTFGFKPPCKNIVGILFRQVESDIARSEAERNRHTVASPNWKNHNPPPITTVIYILPYHVLIQFNVRSSHPTLKY